MQRMAGLPGRNAATVLNGQGQQRAVVEAGWHRIRLSIRGVGRSIAHGDQVVLLAAIKYFADQVKHSFGVGLPITAIGDLKRRAVKCRRK